LIHPPGKICVADKIHPSGLTRLRKRGFKLSIACEIPNEDLVAELSRSGADVLIIRSIRRVNNELLARIRKQTAVKLICTASSGIDHIDMEYARASGIKVINVPNGNFISAAEHTFALILGIVKNLIPFHQDMKAGVFDSKKHLNRELFGKTIGIIGVGRVGSHVAKIARALQMRVVGNDIRISLKQKYKWITFAPLKKLLNISDVVTVHTPLNRSTKDLISAKEISMMKRSAILINCARGEIVNERALVSSLKTGRIAYAGIDVFENEPAIRKELIAQNNVLLTPHVAGKTKESDQRISTELANSICKFFSLSTG